ncbi:cupin domain-containing protein [Nocardia colli]|uniref:cupin domain-containing protein n=1 Tax=Nocardia colli TaxID=2545717 RepID=UPI0035D60AE4
MTSTSPTEPSKNIAVYGATGITGGYLLTELHRRGFTPILVGRNETRIRAAAVAADLPNAEIRVADLADHNALVAAFTGADVVISSLPAYVEHGAAVLAAAIEAGAHYTDMSGEQLFLKQVFDEFGPRAEAAGVSLVPGVTDSNLPGDLLGYLRSDELWLWHRGGPLVLNIGGEEIVLGPDVEHGQVLQAVVPGGVSQAARPAGDEYVLVSCFVSPGFDFADFQMD